jgi:hypothetical protein
MLIKFFKSSFIIQYLALALVTAALWVPGFLVNTGLPEDPSIITPFYNMAHWLLRLWEPASPAAAVAIVFISALTLNNILIFHDLTPKNNILPAFIFILFMGSNPHALSTYPYILTLPFFTWFLHTIFKMNDEPENYMEVFNASILVSVISMIYPIAIILFLFIWMTLLVYGIFNGRNLVISVLAVILPYVYLFLYYFWTDQVPAALTAYDDYFGKIFSFTMNKEAMQLVIWSIFAVFMLLPAFMRISATLSSFNINFRKKMSTVTWMLVFSIPIIIIHGSVDYNTLIFLPAGIMVVHYYQIFKKSLMNEIGLLVFLILVLINNYLHYFNA